MLKKSNSISIEKIIQRLTSNLRTILLVTLTTIILFLVVYRITPTEYTYQSIIRFKELERRETIFLKKHLLNKKISVLLFYNDKITIQQISNDKNTIKKNIDREVEFIIKELRKIYFTKFPEGIKDETILPYKEIRTARRRFLKSYLLSGIVGIIVGLLLGINIALIKSYDN